MSQQNGSCLAHMFHIGAHSGSPKMVRGRWEKGPKFNTMATEVHRSGRLRNYIPVLTFATIGQWNLNRTRTCTAKVVQWATGMKNSTLLCSPGVLRACSGLIGSKSNFLGENPCSKKTIPSFENVLFGRTRRHSYKDQGSCFKATPATCSRSIDLQGCQACLSGNVSFPFVANYCTLLMLKWHQCLGASMISPKPSLNLRIAITDFAYPDISKFHGRYLNNISNCGKGLVSLIYPWTSGCGQISINN